MDKGKKKCEMLKNIRKAIAEEYGLRYEPTVCNHKGDCVGTCPRCDEELRNLQRQLDEKGIADIQIEKIESEVIPTKELEPEHIVGVPADDELTYVTEGMPIPESIWPLQGEVMSPKKRKLYKEIKIAGITFRDLSDVWDELYEGAELALVRDKDNPHDSNAIAVALADDYDGNPEDFDFDFILGYVPRDENKHLASMLDLGWSDVFECELSQVNGHNPYKGSLYMKIYFVSKGDEEEEDTSSLIRILELDKDKHEAFISQLQEEGCCYFRYGGFPPWEHTYPIKGENVVFMYREKNVAYLYLMYCIAVGDDEASYFVKDKDMLHAVDDCCFYVFTNIKGPIKVLDEDIAFLESEPINIDAPEMFLSEEASYKLKNIFEKYAH